jgi:hypothetical protein
MNLAGWARATRRLFSLRGAERAGRQSLQAVERETANHRADFYLVATARSPAATHAPLRLESGAVTRENSDGSGNADPPPPEGAALVLRSQERKLRRDQER